MDFNSELSTMIQVILASVDGLRHLRKKYENLTDDSFEPCKDKDCSSCSECKDTLIDISGSLVGMLTYMTLTIKNPKQFTELSDILNKLESKNQLLGIANKVFASLPKEVIEVLNTTPVKGINNE